MTLDERRPFLIGSQSIVRHSYLILSSCRELIFLHGLMGEIRSKAKDALAINGYQSVQDLVGVLPQELADGQ